MRFHVRLIVGSETLLDETVDGPSATLSSRSSATVRHRKFPQELEVTTDDGYFATLRSGPTRHNLRRRNVFAIDDDTKLHLDLYPRAEASPKVRGACPCCGGGLTNRQLGGAYRSIARDERRCATCDVTVLSLRETTSLVGRFADSSAQDWVMVVTAQRCPQCLQSMTQGRLTTDDGSAEVERCVPCNLLVLEPADRLQLLGRGE